MAARAALTIFDEPTTGMDTAVRKDFYRALLREYIAFPRTVVLSSHLLGELSGLLEDIMLIDGGRLVSMMTADEADDLCIYLTQKGKGGIDDALRRE
jgi:ABC-2 type transport system ATP-binding protein